MTLKYLKIFFLILVVLLYFGKLSYFNIDQWGRTHRSFTLTLNLNIIPNTNRRGIFSVKQ